MSSTSEFEQPAEQDETIPIVELEPPAALPLPPPPEDEWVPVPESTKLRASSTIFSSHNIIPVILGVFSLLLLMLCGFFGTQYFLCLQTSENKMKGLNQRIENKAEMFTQVPDIVGKNKESLAELHNQMIDLAETLKEIKANQGNRCEPPLSHWIKYREHCYHETKEQVSWENCTALCESLNTTFLKTEKNMPMNFLKLHIENNAWLGLSYKENDNEWKWEDDSSPLFDLGSTVLRKDPQEKCAYLNAQTIGIGNCSLPLSCICEKTACT